MILFTNRLYRFIYFFDERIRYSSGERGGPDPLQLNTCPVGVARLVRRSTGSFSRSCFQHGGLQAKNQTADSETSEKRLGWTEVNFSGHMRVFV